MTLAETERELYKDLWANGYKRSGCVHKITKEVIAVAEMFDSILEIGCGDCTSMDILNNEGYTVLGSDIAATREDVIEAPAWKLPFKDNEFDVTYSTDVLEHLPTEMVEDAVKEILRVTKRHSIHVIALWEDIRMNVKIHKTVKPIDWWQDMFDRLNTKGVELKIRDRATWL